ncbi:unnamed protein product [Porites evermanni]|uniref:Uncharacterized protein n=1 Tax=Porites evermanni TaxID=104178 RepID=A0ABN8M9K1_9CNID|nr:unnamed protein product [Porites evermanni]
MTEMFGSKEDFGCPKYSSADSYIGILSAFNGEIQHSKLSRNSDSLEKTRQIKDRLIKIDTQLNFSF